MPKETTLVTFFSPGTFFAESTTKEIASRDTRLAARMARDITERHGARPYGFSFATRITGDPQPDGRGGFLKAPSDDVDVTGLYFLGGELVTYDEVCKRHDPSEDILRSNMRGNGYWIVCVNRNGYRSTQPFEPTSVLLDVNGDVVDRGDAPKWVEYRRSAEAEDKRKFELEGP